MNTTLVNYINILLKYIVGLIISFTQKVMNSNYYWIYLSRKFRSDEQKGSAKEKEELILKVGLVKKCMKEWEKSYQILNL